MLSEASTAARISAPQAAPPRAGRALRRGTDPTTPSLLLAAPLGLFFVAFFAAPLLILIYVSLHNDADMTRIGVGQYVKFLTDPFSLKVLGHTLWLGIEVTAACLLLGYPLAVLYVRCRRSVQAVLTLIILLPLLTSVVVRTFAWIVILGRQGIVNTVLLALGIADAPLGLLYTPKAASSLRWRKFRWR